MTLKRGFPISGKWNTEEIAAKDLFYYAFKVVNMMIEDPRTIIGGIIPFLDLTDFSSSHLKAMPDGRTRKMMIQFRQVI